MAKRFTATEKWIDPWFCGLGERDRLFWIYILDNCNHAGIWQVNKMLLNTYFPDYDPDPTKFEGRIEVLTPEKWFIKKFVEFQYGTLNPENRAHHSVISILKKEGAYKGLVRSLQGRKDKEQDKDMDKDKEKAVVTSEGMFKKPTTQEVEAYAKTIGFALSGGKFVDHYEARGWKYKGGIPMKNWKAAVRTWKTNGFGANGVEKVDPDAWRR